MSDSPIVRLVRLSELQQRIADERIALARQLVDGGMPRAVVARAFGSTLAVLEDDGRKRRRLNPRLTDDDQKWLAA